MIKDRYPVRGFRLNNATYKRLKSLKERDLSWNLIFTQLLDNYELPKNKNRKE